MTYDAIVIGAGAGGEAAASLGSELGGRVAVVERDLVGGLCAYWACMPSKTLLDAAERRHKGIDYAWERASARRDWMISREAVDYPDDHHRVEYLEGSGAEVIRGEARIVGSGRVEVRGDGETLRALETRNIVIATGSSPAIPKVDGLAEAGFWDSDDGTSLRELPSSIVVVGGGEGGVELAQVYIRFGVRTTIVQSTDRLLPRDHPRNAEVITEQLKYEGVEVRTGVRPKSVSVGGAGRRVELTDGSTVEATQVLVAIGRKPSDLRALGAEETGVMLDANGTGKPDAQMRIADGLYVAGDCAGGLQFTHVADYEGRIAVRAALGQRVFADLNAVPRTTFTDPESSAVGISLDEAWAQGIDAFEVTEDFAKTARGYTIEGAIGHVTAVIDRERGTLLGAFAACPGASEIIHEAVLAMKLRVPVAVLADTIHAFPTAARVFGNLMADAAKQLGEVAGHLPDR